MEWGIPVGKYQRSPSVMSVTKLLPSASSPVMRAFPYSMMAHSAAVCQCSSRMPPAVNRMSTPAIDFETASSRTVTSRDHPPSCMRLCESAKGYLKVWTPPASVGGGKKESGFWVSSGALPGPGALALRSPLFGYGFWSCAKVPAAGSIPAAARAADPMPKNPRRETISFFESSLMELFLRDPAMISELFKLLEADVRGHLPKHASVSRQLDPSRRWRSFPVKEPSS